jgi:hypothetical protein
LRLPGPGRLLRGGSGNREGESHHVQSFNSAKRDPGVLHTSPPAANWNDPTDLIGVV